MLYIDKKQSFTKMFKGTDYPFLKGFGEPVDVMFFVTDWNGLNEEDYKDEVVRLAKKAWQKSKPNYVSADDAQLLITLQGNVKDKPKAKKKPIDKPSPTVKSKPKENIPKENTPTKTDASEKKDKRLETVGKPKETVEKTVKEEKQGYVHPSSVEPLVTVEFRKNTIGVAIIKEKPTAYNVSTGKIYQNGFGGAVKALNEYKRQLNDNKNEE